MTSARLNHSCRGGFTVVELLAVMVVVGTIAAAVTPVLVGASQNHTIASQSRTSMDQLDFALMRITRLIKDAPAGESGGASIVRALPSQVAFEDGAEFQQIGSTLWITVPGAAAAPLCVDVQHVEFHYLGADGETDVSADPAETRRMRIELQIGESSLTTTVCLDQAGGS